MSMPFQLELSQLRPLKSPQDIEQLGMVFEELDYRIDDIAVYTDITFDEGSLVESNRLKFAHSLSDALLAAYRYRNLMFQALHRHNELEFLVQVDWNPPYSPHRARLHASSYQSTLFLDGNPDKPTYDPVYYGRQVLNLGKTLYAVLSPRFGWAERGPEDMSPSDEAIRSFRVFDYVDAVYWANFFSPEFVERIGHERLAKPPVGWSEPLPDGGVLYLVASTYFGGDWSGKDRQRARRHFGL
jgi:hypothetical protein